MKKGQLWVSAALPAQTERTALRIAAKTASLGKNLQRENLQHILLLHRKNFSGIFPTYTKRDRIKWCTKGEISVDMIVKLLLMLMLLLVLLWAVGLIGDRTFSLVDVMKRWLLW